LRNIWLPIAILAIFLLISIAALAGLGRNIAQKRDAYSDPLCKAFMDKTPQAVDNMAAKNPGGQEKNKEEQGVAGPESYRAVGKNVSSKYRIVARSGTNQSMKMVCRAPTSSGSMILPRLPHFKTVASRKPDVSA
jgi:hypothetical protein